MMKTSTNLKDGGQHKNLGKKLNFAYRKTCADRAVGSR